MKCPVCGSNSFDDYDYEHSICKECFWEYDPVQVDNPDFSGGANELSLNEYRKVYEKLKSLNSKFTCKNEKDLKHMLELTTNN